MVTINHQDFSKMLSMRTVFCILCFCFSVVIHAQDLKLANHLYETRSYSDAATHFLKINNKDKTVLERLGDCYYFTSNMEEATKWYEKLNESYEDSVTAEYYFRYAQALFGVNEIKKGNLMLSKYKDLATTSDDELQSIEKRYAALKNKKSPYKIRKLLSNTDKSEYGAVFYGKKVVFTAAALEGEKYEWNKENYLDLFEATINKNGDLENITPFSNVINTKWHEGNAVFTKDGNTMYYTGSHIEDGKKIIGKDKINYLNLYKSTKVNGQWSKGELLPFNKENFITEHAALNHDETKLYFASDRPGSLGSLDLYVVDILDDGAYGEPVNLGPTINTEKREQFPFIDRDTLYFASNGHLGLGGLDIYKSIIRNNKYSSPENLYQEINSPLDDFTFSINDTLSIGYISSNREGKSDDIYMFTKNRDTQTIPVEVRDSKTKALIDNAIVKLIIDEFEANNNKTVTGKTQFKTPYNPYKNYKIAVEHEFYEPKEQALILDDNSRTNEAIVFYLDNYTQIEEKIVVKNDKIQITHEPILFDLNSSYLTNTAKLILNDVVAVLNKHPNIVIRCESHTDSRATNKYNMWLSERRARSTANYIIEQGISPERITKQGYGETQILNGCENGIPCTEEQHQLNRRTEFVLIPKD